MSEWQPIDSAPKNRRVMTKADDGSENILLFECGLWWDDEDYIYSAPTHWRELEFNDIKP